VIARRLEYPLDAGTQFFHFGGHCLAIESIAETIHKHVRNVPTSFTLNSSVSTEIPNTIFEFPGTIVLWNVVGGVKAPFGTSLYK